MRSWVFHKLRLARRHPWWALDEAAARVRWAMAPRRGARRGRIGSLVFEFDLDLDPMVRRMLAGAYETHVTRVIRKVLNPGDAFVDVGANIGYLSCVAASRVGPAGRVLSFEPAPPYYARLSKARALNPAWRWETFQVAVAQATGTAQLTLSSRNIGWNTLVPGQIPKGAANQVVSVTTVSLDEALASAGVEYVRLLKIDTEGYEGHVLLGAADYLRQARIGHILVEMLPRQYPALGLDLEQVVGLLRECGYEPYASRHPYRRLAPAEITDGTDVWFRGRGK